jgi:serine/threonine protein kinase
MTLGQAGAVLAERYQLVRLVGTAIDGEIWQGQDQRLARSVTVRLAATGQGGPDGEGGDEFDVQPLVARLSRINDPGVAAVYDVGVDGGLRYAVGEWIHGRTLGQIFATGRQPWQRAADWGQQVGAALSSLHGAGIVHGTMTAESIAIQDDRRTKIIDLGLVAHTADDGENPDFDETVVSRGRQL